MDLLKELKKLSKKELDMRIFTKEINNRVSGKNNYIKSVDSVSIETIRNKDNNFVQNVFLRNIDFDDDYITSFYDAKGLEYDLIEDPDIFEEKKYSLEINSIKSIRNLIEMIKLNINTKSEKINYEVLSSINGSCYTIKSLVFDSYSSFGVEHPCFIIEVEKKR